MDDGRRVLVPYVAEGSGVYGRKAPQGPAYFGATTSEPGDLPGPASVARPLRKGSIGWIERREERGEPFVLNARWLDEMGDVRFSRAIQPDPDDPFRVGLVVVRAEPGGRFHRRTAETLVCLQALEPLGPRDVGGSCFQPGGVNGPIVTSGFAPTEFTRVGLAVDGVDSLIAHLSTGRRLEARLHDNVFSFRAPFAEFPAKLVAHDADGRIVGIQVLAGPRRLKPCPQAVFLRKAGQLPPPRPYERVDLALRTVNGEQILGRTAADVIAPLGRPARIRYPSDTDRSAITELRYGSGGADFSLQVQFGVRGSRRVATFVVIQGPSTVDARLGHILRMQPTRPFVFLGWQ